MIRHSKSLLTSIVIHVAILLAILFTWNTYLSSENVSCSTDKECDRVSVTLCNVADAPKVKPKPKKIKQEKQIEQKTPKVEKTISKIIIPKKVVPIVENKELVNKEVEEVVKKEPLRQKSVQEIANERKLKQEVVVTEYIKINTQAIAMLLQDNLYYPRSARKRGITGKVLVKFTLGVDSKASNIHVISSNSDILSRAARKTIEDLSGEFPPPTEEITLHVPIGYALR
ncbi:TonB family protein [Sulfurimonas sp.]|nr:TonB family protein [Sulfurimonas sp.]